VGGRAADGPPARLQLFLPFSQASTKTYSKYGGSGMGLYITRALLDLMGGSIRVASRPSQGTTFTVTVPCELLDGDAALDNDEDVRPDRPLVKAQSPKAPRAVGPGKFRILVVEDNDINQALLRRQLETAPGGLFAVEVASNGQEAVELSAPRAPFDLILMDVEMPVMDGLEATARIRERERLQGVARPVPIVGLSGNVRQVWPPPSAARAR
jgi:CheY-like chemotaxis protein